MTTPDNPYRPDDQPDPYGTPSHSGPGGPDGPPPHPYGSATPYDANPYGSQPPSPYGGPPPGPYSGQQPGPFSGPPPSPYGGMPPNPYGGPPSSPYGGMPPNPYGGPPPSPYGGYGAGGFGRGAQIPAPVTAGAAVARGFSLFGRSAGVLIGVTAVVGVAAIALQGVGSALLVAFGLTGGSLDTASTPTLTGQALSYAGGIVLAVVTGLFSSFASLVVAIGTLRIARTGRATFAEFFQLPRGWAVYVLVLAGLQVLTSFAPTIEVQLLLSLVAFVAQVAIIFASFHLVDSPGDVGRAFQGSARMVGANLGQTLLLVLIAVGLVFAGALLCLVGLLVALPVVSLALAGLYCGFRREVVAA